MLSLRYERSTSRSLDCFSFSFWAGRKLFAASTTISDEIKTLDMSLPSYDSISSSKASVGNVDELVEKYNPEPSTPGMARKKKEKEGGGGNPLGSVLPSMNKSMTKKPKSKSATAKSAAKEKEDKAMEIKTMDLTLPSYSATQEREKSVFSL